MACEVLWGTFTNLRDSMGEGINSGVRLRSGDASASLAPTALHFTIVFTRVSYIDTADWQHVARQVIRQPHLYDAAYAGTGWLVSTQKRLIESMAAR